jgi:hypothetical protein
VAVSDQTDPPRLLSEQLQRIFWQFVGELLLPHSCDFGAVGPVRSFISITRFYIEIAKNKLPSNNQYQPVVLLVRFVTKLTSCSLRSRNNHLLSYRFPFLFGVFVDKYKE